MIVIPAIDLRAGRVVRLVQGRAESETVFGDDPVAVAMRWAEWGAPRLHVVDLDGAFAGVSKQTALIREIIGSVTAPVQVGGGLRTLEAISVVLEAGAGWAVPSTRAALDGRFLAEACRRYPGRIIVAVDASGGRVAVDGWRRILDRSAVELAQEAALAGAAAILYTDIPRDGTEAGPNLESTTAVAQAAGAPVLASGGVGRLADLNRLAAIPGVAGAVIGRALYSGAVDLREALATVG
ncbi:MAG: HisA/HisF-related TIM barrel protein [Candidatus Methylomirabilia bacterium]